MRYRSALVIADSTSHPKLAMAALGAVSDVLENVVIVVRRPPDVDQVDAWNEPSEVLCAGWSRPPVIRLHHVVEWSTSAMIDLGLAAEVDLIVGGDRTRKVIDTVKSVAPLLGVASLWPGVHDTPTVPARHLLCAGFSASTRAAIAAFLRDHATPAYRATVVSPVTLEEGDLVGVLRVLGISAKVSVIARSQSLRTLLDAASSTDSVDLIVTGHVPMVLLVNYSWPAPILEVPPIAVSTNEPKPLDVTDAVTIDGAIRLLVEETLIGESVTAVATQVIAFMSEGEVVANVLTTDLGEAELPLAITGKWLGAARVVDELPIAPQIAANQRFAVLRPGDRPVVVFDSALPTLRLKDLPKDCDVVAVRLRPNGRASTIRRRLYEAGYEAYVLDARVVLDEGAAFDVNERNDSIRLKRVAAKLKGSGFDVRLFTGKELESAEIYVSQSFSHNRVELEINNRLARAWLLDGITNAQRTINLQTYITADDAVGKEVEAALVGAAARGVCVRVLVDSLHSFHGSFGTQNPLLTRLANHESITVKVARPVTSLPSMKDLKLRDHRKLTIFDDEVALVGGRNIAHEYYTNFDEVQLSAKSDWRLVPWLDGGARVKGPAVSAISESFLTAWTQAGGQEFPILPVPPAGDTDVGVVVHRGLNDANSLELYLDVIRKAEKRIVMVTGFPLLLELQRALLKAMSRHVKLQILTGHFEPNHDGVPFVGMLSTARTTATDLVHSRLDPIVEAGGEVYLLAERMHPSWDENLGTVFPHVHGKIMCVDSTRCTVGSANFDVTSAYWESEIVLDIVDKKVVSKFEEEITSIFPRSVLIDREDETWRANAQRRMWMRRWPGSLSL